MHVRGWIGLKYTANLLNVKAIRQKTKGKGSKGFLWGEFMRIKTSRLGVVLKENLNENV